MGTRNVLRVTDAATLAGGSNNQDRYAYGDTWAFVLDGATSWGDKPAHDGGWYAQRLSDALAASLTGNPEASTVQVVADAIRMAASEHESRAEPCPESTIALVRWGSGEVETYALGDSLVTVFIDGKPHTITDDRLTSVAPEIRARYHGRLRSGAGYDDAHWSIMADLQTQELRARNTSAGYWIASDNPAAAQHGVTQRFPDERVSDVLVMSDGLTKLETSDALMDWLSASPAAGRLRELFDREASDPSGRDFPRSKPHDDKTIIQITRP